MRFADYKILSWSILLVLPLFVLGPQSALDIQYHDSYLVLGSIHLAAAFIIFLAILAASYWLLRDYKLIRSVSMLHTIVTISTIVVIIMITVLQSRRREIDIQRFLALNPFIIRLFMLLFWIQMVFVLNMLLGLIRGHNKN